MDEPGLQVHSPLLLGLCGWLFFVVLILTLFLHCMLLVVVVFSLHSVESEYVNNELKRAAYQEAGDEEEEESSEDEEEDDDLVWAKVPREGNAL